MTLETSLFRVLPLFHLSDVPRLWEHGYLFMLAQHVTSEIQRCARTPSLVNASRIDREAFQVQSVLFRSA